MRRKFWIFFFLQEIKTQKKQGLEISPASNERRNNSEHSHAYLVIENSKEHSPSLKTKVEICEKLVAGLKNCSQNLGVKAEKTKSGSKPGLMNANFFRGYWCEILLNFSFKLLDSTPAFRIFKCVQNIR